MALLTQDLACRIQHILNKDPISGGGIVHQHMGHYACIHNIRVCCVLQQTLCLYIKRTVSYQAEIHWSATG